MQASNTPPRLRFLDVDMSTFDIDLHGLYGGYRVIIICHDSIYLSSAFTFKFYHLLTFILSV